MIFFRPKQSSFCGMFPFFGKVWTCFFHGDSRLPCLTWLGFYQRNGWDADPHWDGGPGGQVMELFERKRSAMVEKILGAARRASLAK